MSAPGWRRMNPASSTTDLCPDDRDMTGLAKYLADLGVVPPGTDIEHKR